MLRDNKTLGLFLILVVLIVSTNSIGQNLVRMTTNTQLTSFTPNDMQWHQTYGEIDTGIAYSVIQTTDGGFVFGGATVLIKTDANGIPQWHQTYGGKEVKKVIQTFDGGFALAACSYGSDWSANMWLVKTDNNGVVQWSQKTYEGYYGEDDICSVVQTTDSGFVLIGWTRPYGISGRDIWLVKTDANGILTWNQTYIGGSEDLDGSYAVVQTTDGGFALAGEASSSGGDRWSDMWLVKTDNDGFVVWNHTYGGLFPETAWSIIQTTDGGFVLAGETWSYSSSTSENDMWLVKTDNNGTAQWNSTYGGNGHEITHSVIQTTDGGFALAGYTSSYGAGSFDMWLVKTDINGIMQGHQTYGGTKDEEAYSVIQTTEGDFVLAGYTKSFGTGESDMWLVRTYTPTTLETTTVDSKIGLIELPFFVFFLIFIVIIGHSKIQKSKCDI